MSDDPHHHGPEGDLDAGDFRTWLDATEDALRGERDAEVPCGACVACCSSSQFVHIEPDEVDTLAHIPRELVFPAPSRPKGHVLLGYDERGRCPMLTDRGCSIYDHRPRTCRTYDCRVFAATGVQPDDPDSPVAVQVRRWRFRYGDPADAVAHDALQAAAAELERRAAERDASVPLVSTHRAVMAVEQHLRSR